MKEIRIHLGCIDFLKVLVYEVEDKVYRRIHILPRVGREPGYPFLSCDTYAWVCDQELETNASRIIFESNETFFAKVCNVDFVLELLENTKIVELAARTLVIGDSDHCPPIAVLERLSNYFRNIYCVNLNIDFSHPKIEPIPLGLESPRYRNGGKLSNFRQLPQYKVSERPISILVCWNDETNPTSRLEARRQIESIESSIQITNRISGASCHYLMRKSLFVACPAGNGLDTHRFWESLYLGAVPIVKKSERTKAFLGWPHLAVDEWADLREYSFKDFQEKYRNFEEELVEFRQKAQSLLSKVSGK